LIVGQEKEAVRSLGKPKTCTKLLGMEVEVAVNPRQKGEGI
jgi:hypothetical protein